MKLALATAALSVTLIVSGQSFADGLDKCTEEAKDKWMTSEQISAKAVELGYEVKEVEESGTCYEIYGVKDGKTFELFLNPVTAEVMLTEEKGS